MRQPGQHKRAPHRHITSPSSIQHNIDQQQQQQPTNCSGAAHQSTPHASLLPNTCSRRLTRLAWLAKSGSTHNTCSPI